MTHILKKYHSRQTVICHNDERIEKTEGRYLWKDLAGQTDRTESMKAAGFVIATIVLLSNMCMYM